MLSLFLSAILVIPVLARNASQPAFPSGCETHPRSIPITDFKFFNSTHNLDCVNEDPNFYLCLDNNDKVCDPGPGGHTNPSPDCPFCIPACDTGIPSYQPAGYGPPDYVSYNIQTTGPVYGRQCGETNPQSIRRYDIGDGIVGCGGAGTYSDFQGSSNLDKGNKGTISWQYQTLCGGNDNYYELNYAATFPLACTRDSGGNATCTAAAPIVATYTGQYGS